MSGHQPNRQPVGPRVPKVDFMRALGLDENNPQHEGYYRQMRDQAIGVYSGLNHDRTCLVDDKRNDPNCQPPYFWHHIRADRKRRAILETWQQARVGSIERQLFDQGATTGEHEPNWVTLWLLYSVFRSRDIRNNRNRRGGDGGGGGGPGGNGGRGSGTDAKIYDPARNIMVAR